MRTATTKIALLLTAFFCFLAPRHIHAQAGLLDTTYYMGQGTHFKCTGGVSLPDSSVIIIGKFNYCNERVINGIARLFKDGTMDYSFNPGSGADEHINAIVRQPDGKLVIAGDFRTFNGDSVFHITRLNADGSRDLTFNSGQGVSYNGTVYTLYLQPDGKILIGGIFGSYDGSTVNGIARLQANGLLDPSFNTGIGTGNPTGSGVYSIDRQADGKFIVAGDFLTYNTVTVNRIMRLNTDGTLDNTFNGVTTGANSIITTAYVLPNQQIIAAGYFTYYNGDTVNRIVRINSNGSTDLLFKQQSGTGFNSNVNELAVTPAGRIYATGNFTRYNGVTINRVVLIDTSGARNTSFLPGGGPNLSVNSVWLHTDSARIYLGGTFTLIDSFSRLHVGRLLTSGVVDQTFYRESKLNNSVTAIAYQQSGKAIIGGAFTKYNQVSTNRIARLNLDGSLDNTFLQGTGANGLIRSIMVLPDDKILIGGDFTKYNNITANRIARLNADGSFDNTFTSGTGASAGVYNMQLSGSFIYICGNFTTYGGTSAVRLARLNLNGTLDNTFNVGTGFSAVVTEICLQTDGKILAVGNFTSFNGTAINRIARLNTTGTIDNTFTPGTGANALINAIALQADGKIIIGGSFTTYNSGAKLRIARLNSDGTPDAGFTGTIGNNVVNDIVFTQGGILVGGSFTLAGGLTRNRLAFFKSTGALDSTGAFFYIGAGADAAVNIFAVNSTERRILAGGLFADIQVRLANKIGRLQNTFIDLLSIDTVLCPGATTHVIFSKQKFFNIGNQFTVQLSDSNGSFSNPVNIGTSSSGIIGLDSINVVFPLNASFGNNYRIRIISTNTVDTSNLSLPIHIAGSGTPVITPNGPTAFCNGGSLQLAAPAGTHYIWSTGDSTQTITVTTTGSYTVTVSTGSCSGASQPLQVTVNASPDSSIIITSSSLCSSGSFSLLAAPGLSYSWSNGAATQNISVTQPGSYTVTVTNGAGCKSDSTIIINSVTLANSLISANGPTTFCQGGNVTLTSSPGYTYTWSSGATTQSIVVTTAGTYRVTVSDGTCSATSSNITVTVNAAPTATITINGPASICTGGGPTVLNAAPNLQYNWSTGATTQSITVANPGTYLITVTNSSNCSATGTSTIASSSPAPSVTANGPVTFCHGGSVTLSAPANLTYSWNTGASTQSITVDSSGSYVVTVSDVASACTAVSSAVVVTTDTCTGINEVGYDGALKLYPNPAVSQIFVSSTLNNLKNLEVTDLLGNIVLHFTVQGTSSIYAIDVSMLAAGTYFVQADNRKLKFIKTQ